MDLCDSADEWASVALGNLASAVHLHQAHMHAQAYNLAGQAVECALKSLIMKRGRMNRWPDRSARRDLYTHDLLALATIAGIDADLNSETLGATELGAAWMVVANWTVMSRYATRLKPREARDIVWAARTAGSTGLVRWIIEK